MAVAVVEMWPVKRSLKKSQCIDFPRGQLKNGHCREVAVSRGSTVVCQGNGSLKGALNFNFLKMITNRRETSFFS